MCNKDYNTIWAQYHNSDEKIVSIKNETNADIRPIYADFNDEASTMNMIEQIQSSQLYPCHIVHLAAPKAYNRQFYKCSWNDFFEEMNTSFRSAVLILMHLMPNMVKQGYGKVIFMLTAYLNGFPPKFQSSYITTKYALYGLMRSLSAEYADKGIAVNAISPEMTETKFLSQLPELILEQSAKSSPRGKNVSVEEIIPAME